MLRENRRAKNISIKEFRKVQIINTNTKKSFFPYFESIQACRSIKNLSPLTLQFVHAKVSECPKR